MKGFLYSMALVAGMVFVLLLAIGPYPYSFVLKAIPAVALGVLAFLYAPFNQGKLIALGLFFGAGGDVALDIDPEGLFIVGLGLFFVNHILYILAFFSERGRDIPAWRKALAYSLVGFSTIMFSVLAPRLGEMQIPVAAYIGVITLMGIAACLRKADHSWFVLGAVLFVFSDACIAVNKFLLPVPFAGYFIMITYYLAQLTIAHGALQRTRR